MNDRMIPLAGFYSWNVGQCLRVVTVLLLSCIAGQASSAQKNTNPAPPPELEPHLAAIAGLAQPSLMVKIPEGWFLMGTVRKDDDPFGLETQYDDTEFPQRRIWLTRFQSITMK